MKSSSPSSYYPLTVLQPHRLRYVPVAGWSLALGEPGVPRRVCVLSVKLLKFLQTVYQKVVIWFFRPVLLVWVVEPLDEVQDTAPFPSAPRDLVNIVLLALFDIVGLSEDLLGVQQCSVFAGSIRFE